MRPTYLLAFSVLVSPVAAAAEPSVTDLHVIPLHDGVNAVPRFAPDGRDGVIVRAERHDSPIADGDSVDYMALISSAADRHWLAVTTAETLSLVSDHPFGGVLLSAAPHTGEDWKRSVLFARARVDGAPAVVMILGERDMRRAENAYSAVPAEISVFELQPDSDDEGQAEFVRIAHRRTARCYVDVQLAVSETELLPLPPDYAGPKASQPCPPGQ